MLLLKGSSGALVAALKQRVAEQLGAAVAAAYPSLADGGNVFDSVLEGAVRRWQAGVGLLADGIVGPHCLSRLGLRDAVAMEIKPDAEAVRLLFAQTKPSNIVRYLPYVTDALEDAGLVDRESVLAALGTIRANAAGFVPIPEYPSTNNTLPGQPPFSKYADGAKYRGRGYVQLRGAASYKEYGTRLGIPLLGKPDLATAPEVASVLLATWVAEKKADVPKSFFDAAAKVWPVPRAKARVGATQKPAVVRKRVTRKDPPDIRDREFIPAPVSLPDVHPPDSDVMERIADYRALVLDQGQDSSCTGYGLACVINFALWGKGGYRKAPNRVSARMIYNNARRYDEYAGEDYDGSSCRGALKGWFYNGVCSDADWPDGGQPQFGYVERARNITLGVYLRIDIKSVTDMQAAVLQSHAIYVSAFTHNGWDKLVKAQPSKLDPLHANLEVIAWDGRPSKTGGHAFAIVGFNEKGFVIQNSWGADFGVGGFAVLSYADWLSNGMDAWLAGLGVPGVVAGMLASTEPSSAGAAGGGVDKSQWWTPGHAMAHSIIVGDDGRVSRYQGSDENTRTLLNQACTMPDTYFRTEAAAKACGDVKRIVIYAHGGLNSQDAALQRAQAMGRFFWGNGCYPLFLVWRTGLLESIGDLLRKPGDNVPVVRGVVSDVTDRLIEKTIGRGPGRAIWTDMKDKAKNACDTSRACDLLVTALQNLSSMWDDQLEIHLVGHSAGSIILGYLLEVMAARGLNDRVKSTHLFAPACTVQFANRYYAPQSGVMDKLYLQVLADKEERDDDVAFVYRKSLLYLVSDALEMDERTPLMGLANVLDGNYAGWDGSSTTMEALANWRAAMKPVLAAQRIKTISDDKVPTCVGAGGKVIDSINATHGSFDNSVTAIDETLRLITGVASLPVPVDDLRGY